MNMCELFQRLNSFCTINVVQDVRESVVQVSPRVISAGRHRGHLLSLVSLERELSAQYKCKLGRYVWP